MNALLTDLTWLGLFLIIGLVIREIVKPLQKIFLSASIIGGLLMLVLGPQVCNLVVIPKSFGGYSGAMIRFIMCALCFGTNINKEKLQSYGDYMMVVHSVYGLQMALGLLIGAICCTVWTTLPQGWGFLAVQAFYGGHGTASAAGNAFEAASKITDYKDLGIVMATFGIIIAMTVGMVVVNIGVRKGWATFVHEVQKQPPHFYGGLLPKEEQASIGTSKTTATSINALGLQFGFILMSMWLGERFGNMVVSVLPMLSKVSTLAWDTIGGVIGWYFLKLIRLDKFVDKKTVNQLAGLALEILLVGSMATLNLTVLAANIVPLCIMTAIICGITIIWTLWMAKMTCNEQWFEKALMIIGQSTGATPTGMALVRSADPNSEACSPEAHGVYSGVCFWTAFFTSLLPPLLASGNMSVTYIAGIVQFVIPVAIGFLIFRPLMLKARRARKQQA